MSLPKFTAALPTRQPACRQTQIPFHHPQGTAATALAGLYGAMRVMGLPPSALGRQRVLCVGAGSAGMGVVRMIAAGGLTLTLWEGPMLHG